ncbi:MAG TPA: SulP family inorganic anion transporter [Bacteroidia bacterium]|nr:SulP family inorganic anion transporter [Bacteroidia bacterium]
MKYNSLLADLKAGLVVFLVALPLCLGIALAQNVPLFSGLIAGIVGGIVVAAISGSRLSVSGPAAGLTSVVLSSLLSLGSFENFLLALCVAGIIQILLGLLKAGVVGYFIPSAVIKGMLAAIGLILIIKQVPHLFGYDQDVEGDEDFLQTDGKNSFTELADMFHQISPGSALIGIFCLLLMFVWQSRYFRRFKRIQAIPAALVVALSGTILSLCFSFAGNGLEIKPEHLVNLPEFHSLDDLLHVFILPNFGAIKDPKIYQVGLVIAVVASLETLLSIEAVDKLDPDNRISPTNRELFAQGAGNLVCGLIGGIPITSVIVRSSVNVSAGGKTQISSIVHGLLFLIAIFLIPGWLEMIPLSALAAILIATGVNLSKPALFRNTFKQGWDQFLPFMLTIVVMLFTDLLMGVGAGIVLAVVFILRQQHKAPFKLIRDEINGQVNVFMKLTQNVTFINKGKFIDVFRDVPENAVVYIDGGRSVFIDKDVLEVITAFKNFAHVKNITVHLEQIPEVDVYETH